MSTQKKYMRKENNFYSGGNCRTGGKVRRIPSSAVFPSADRSFAWLLDCWRQAAWIGQKGPTRQKYDFLIERHILPALGGYLLKELTPETLNAFIDQKLCQGRLDGGGTLSPAYVRSMAIIINAALAFAAEEFALPLPKAVHKPYIEKKEVVVLTISEQKRLESQLLAEPTATGLGILLSLNTGLRIGEACALTWANIGRDDNILSVTGTVVRKKAESGSGHLVIDVPKTPTSLRRIPIPSKLHSILDRMRVLSAGEYVLSGNGTFVSPRTYEYRFHKVLAECGIRPINYHVLRHTFATRCIESGMDVKTLSELLGHANTTTTLNTYVHSSMDRKRIQMERLSTLLD